MVQALLSILIITGGHGFDRDGFFAMFKSFEDVRYMEVEQPKANDMYKPEEAEKYDVIVLYDMVQPITEEQKAALVALLKKGRGLVALHHSLASYQEWPEFEKIIGGRFHLNKWVKDGVEQPASTAAHGVKVPVKIADPEHPITRGMKDFELADEIYGGYSVDPGVHVLLKTSHPQSTETIGWCHKYGASRVVYLQSGHDNAVYSDPNYRQILGNAIRWVAGRL